MHLKKNSNLYLKVTNSAEYILQSVIDKSFEKQMNRVTIVFFIKIFFYEISIENTIVKLKN